MLVYLKEPMGRTEIDGYVICGEHYNWGRIGPANIPYDVYKNNREVLKEIPITSDWLKSKFGVDFPPVSFIVQDFWQVEWATLVQVARLMGIDYIGRVDREPSGLHKKALRQGVLRKIEQAG